MSDRSCVHVEPVGPGTGLIHPHAPASVHSTRSAKPPTAPRQRRRTVSACPQSLACAFSIVLTSWESLIVSVERHPTTGSACVEHCRQALTAMLVKSETLRALRGLYAPCSQAKAKPTRRRLPWPSPSTPRGGQGPFQTSR